MHQMEAKNPIKLKKLILLKKDQNQSHKRGYFFHLKAN